MNTSTYRRFSSTVSTCRKSTARIPAAWACRNCRHVGPERRGAGSMPAARRISHTVDGATAMPSFASSPWIRQCPHSGFSLARRTTRRAIPSAVGGRPGVRRLRVSYLPPASLRCQARSVAGVTGEDPGPAPARQEPCQRGEPHPVARLVLYPAGIPAQHRVLMPEHEQLDILRPVTAEPQDGQAEHPARQQVSDLEQHPASQPPLDPPCRQTVQVTHPIEYSSGTGSAAPGTESATTPTVTTSPWPRPPTLQWRESGGGGSWAD